MRRLLFSLTVVVLFAAPGCNSLGGGENPTADVPAVADPGAQPDEAAPACQAAADCQGKVAWDAQCQFPMCESSQCVVTNKDDGLPCDDGNAQSTDDTCKGGVCAGTILSCGNGTCEPGNGENSANCAIDCPSECGNGTCETSGGETCASCVADCACPGGQVCREPGTCCTPQCEGRQCGADGCGGTCGDCRDGGICQDGSCTTPPADCTVAPCPQGYYCDLVGKQCIVGCLSDTHCPSGKNMICDTQARQCVCKAGNHLCDDTCVDNDSDAHCGASCTPCGCGTTCDGSKCAFVACSGKKCGPDGCGGTCGACKCGEVCQADGSCKYTACDGKVCGDDGCGNSCGTCGDGFCAGGECFEKGAVAFNFTVEGYTITSDPVVGADGTAYVTTDFPFQLVAISKAGTKKWALTAPDDKSYWGVLIAKNGTVITRLSTDTLLGLDPSDGSTNWKLTATLDTMALASDGSVVGTYFDSTNGKYELRAYKPGDGLKWATQLGPLMDQMYWFTAQMAIASDGTVYVAAPDKKLYAVSATGAIKWSTQLDANSLDDSAPAIGADGTIYVDNGDLIDSQGRYLYALNPANGAVKWKFESATSSVTWPVVGPDGTIYFASGSFIYAVSSAGTLKWKYDTGNPLYSGVTVSRHGMVFSAGYDQVDAVDAQGKFLWKYVTGNDSPLVLTDDGLLYVNYSTGSGSHLIALDVTTTPGSPWPMWGHDARHSARYTDALGTPPN